MATQPDSPFQYDTSNEYLADVNSYIPCKKQKLTSSFEDQKVDQFPTYSTTAQSLQEREGFPAMSQSQLNSFSSMELDIGATHTDQPLAESRFQSDTSNGYLEDVITGWGIMCKEQKLPSCSKDQKVDQIPIISTTAQPLDDCGFTHQERFLTTNISSSPQSDTHEAAIKHDPARSSYASGQRTKIAYPFKLVKSLGIEGETTLKDINHHILTTPSASKPIPHPVKVSETRPSKLASLSGKAVTSITRIPTRGKGSITIIRTKD